MSAEPNSVPVAKPGFLSLPVLACAGLLVVGALIARSAPPGPVHDTNSAPAEMQSATPVAAPLLASALGGNGSLTPQMRGEFEVLIKDYLLRNPEIMAEVQAAYEAKMEKLQEAKSVAALKDNAKAVFQLGAAPHAGNPKGDVTIVEFFDYNCGYCKRALPDVAAFVQSDKNVRLVLKEFPILSKGSEEASRVAIAAKQQGKYWDFFLAMLNQQGQANEASALKVAEKVGLDMNKLKADMAAPAVNTEIKETRALAEKMGISGTPHFLVGDKVISGAPEDLAQVLANDVAEVRKAGGCKVCGG